MGYNPSVRKHQAETVNKMFSGTRGGSTTTPTNPHKAREAEMFTLQDFIFDGYNNGTLSQGMKTSLEVQSQEKKSTFDKLKSYIKKENEVLPTLDVQILGFSGAHVYGRVNDEMFDACVFSNGEIIPHDCSIYYLKESEPGMFTKEHLVGGTNRHFGGSATIEEKNLNSGERDLIQKINAFENDLENLSKETLDLESDSTCM